MGPEARSSSCLRNGLAPWYDASLSTMKGFQMDAREGKKLHDAIGFVGLRAHATAVGLIQLTSELAAAGVLDQAAVGRIKVKIAQDLALNMPPHAIKEDFEEQTRQRLDRLFSGEEKLEPLETVPSTPGL
jgi:hypothetical protein